MSETTQTNSMIDTLLGRDINTDHGGMTLGDVIVLILDAVLLIYTSRLEPGLDLRLQHQIPGLDQHVLFRL